jgi:predicted Rdx family selenoprotein
VEEMFTIMYITQTLYILAHKIMTDVLQQMAEKLGNILVCQDTDGVASAMVGMQ